MKCRLTQHHTSTHQPSPPMQYPVMSHDPPVQTPHSASSLSTEEFSSHLHLRKNPKTKPKKQLFNYFCVYGLHTSNATQVTSHCCSAALSMKGVSRVPLIQWIYPVATWLCSAPDIMAWQSVLLYIGLLLRRRTSACTGSRNAFETLPVHQDTARFAATSRPDRQRLHYFVQGAERPSHA